MEKYNVLNHIKGYYEDLTKEELLEKFTFAQEPNWKDISEIAIFDDCIEIYFHHNNMMAYKNNFGTWVGTRIR